MITGRVEVLNEEWAILVVIIEQMKVIKII